MKFEEKAKEMRERGINIMTAAEKLEYDSIMKNIRERQKERELKEQEELKYKELINELLIRVKNLEEDMKTLLNCNNCGEF